MKEGGRKRGKDKGGVGKRRRKVWMECGRVGGWEGRNEGGRKGGR